MLNKSRMDVVAQIFVVAQIVKSFIEKNDAGDSLLPVDYDEVSENVSARVFQINERADEVRLAAFNDSHDVIKELLAVGRLPIVISRLLELKNKA